MNNLKLNWTAKKQLNHNEIYVSLFTDVELLCYESCSESELGEV